MDATDASTALTNLPDSAQLSTLDKVRWHKAPSVADLDLGKSPSRMFVVKHGEHRSVYRVDLSQGEYFLKHQQSRSIRDLLRNLIRPSGSRREYHKSAELTRRGIPTVNAVAWGERREFGIVSEHCLLTEAVPKSCSLAEYVEARDRWVPCSAQPVFERHLCVELAKLCSKAHRAGVWHDDLHPGNILLRFENDTGQLDSSATLETARPRLYLIDVPGVRLSRTLGWRRSRASLVMLLAAVDRIATRTMRLRFWHHYIDARDDLRGLDSAVAAADIVRRSRSWIRSLARHRDKRVMATNRDFYRCHVAGGRGHAVRDYDVGQLRQLIESPQQLIERNLELPLKISHSSIVVEADVPLSGTLQHALYKRIGVTNITKWLTSFFRQSRAEQSWRLGHALLVRGIATARPLAVVIPKWRLRPRVSFLVTEWIDGAKDFHQFAWFLAKLPKQECFRISCRVAENLGKLVGRMHEAHVTHRDLKGCNILITREHDDVSCYLIDMHGVEIRRFLTTRQQVRNLSRLALSTETHPWVTRTMRLRFLRTYCRAVGVKQEWKPLWRRIAARTSWLVEQNHQQGKPIA